MENKELTIADILDVTKKVKLVERVRTDGKITCEGCILSSLCGEVVALRSNLCFQGADEEKDWVYVFDNGEE